MIQLSICVPFYHIICEKRRTEKLRMETHSTAWIYSRMAPKVCQCTKSILINVVGTTVVLSFIIRQILVRILNLWRMNEYKQKYWWTFCTWGMNDNSLAYVTLKCYSRKSAWIIYMLPEIVFSGKTHLSASGR